MVSTSSLVNATKQKDTLTENMAVTHSTSLNTVVDLFFIAGASRSLTDARIKQMLEKSWAEDPLLTMKVIFWAGNCRGGAGERRFFRLALKWAEENYEDSLVKNLALVPQFNRWDSLFHLKFENIINLIHKGLKKKDGLLGKWLPRKKQYGNLASEIRKDMKMTPKQYRKMVVELSKTVEQQMCAKNWPDINYSHVPSVAMNKYRKAFFRNDNTRFAQFIAKAVKGETKINAAVLFPYQLFQAMERGEDKNAIEAQWKALPDYLKDTDEKILPVCDVSGSMQGLPLAISVSLGLYLSERNKSIFKDAFVTFSGSPTMEYLKGTVVQRMKQLEEAHWDGNTDLNAVFELLLKRAVAESVPESEMPTMILIISDMEFDGCAQLTNYENIVKKYTSAGYTIPKIVFWNVNAHSGRNVPVSAKSKNVALVSGATAAVIKGVLTGKDFSPYGIMLETLDNAVYDVVKV